MKFYIRDDENNEKELDLTILNLKPNDTLIFRHSPGKEYSQIQNQKILNTLKDIFHTENILILNYDTEIGVIRKDY